MTGDRWQWCEQGMVSVIPKKMQHQEEAVLQVHMGWDGPLGGGEPVGEEARDHWTENKQYCHVLSAEPVRL